MVEIREGRAGRVVFARLSPGDDLIAGLKEIAARTGVTWGVFTIIGTLKQVSMGFYSPTMRPVLMTEPLEILSCIGSISRRADDYVVHAHIDVSDSKLHSYGGHLLEGSQVDKAGEVALFELQGEKVVEP
ncbi:MAG: DUF296 domain-containing protein [Candidatus Bathyarchaeia archaeon]